MSLNIPLVMRVFPPSPIEKNIIDIRLTFTFERIKLNGALVYPITSLAGYFTDTCWIQSKTVLACQGNRTSMGVSCTIIIRAIEFNCYSTVSIQKRFWAVFCKQRKSSTNFVIVFMQNIEKLVNEISFLPLQLVPMPSLNQITSMGPKKENEIISTIQQFFETSKGTLTFYFKKLDFRFTYLQLRQ